MGKSFVPVIYGVPAERPDEADAASEAAVIATALASLGHATETVAVDLDFRVLEQLAHRRPLVVFNLVESLRGDGRLAHIASAFLDHLGLPYTGAPAGAYFLANSKLFTKELLRAHGLPTPRWWANGEDVPAARRVIVKSVDEHASLGIDVGSVVAGARAHAEVASRERRFGFRFFAEEFIDGREFNLALIEEHGGPRVLPIPEMTFDGLPADRPRIVDYDAKWASGTAVYELTRRRFGCEDEEPDLARRLTRLAFACWRGFGLSGYARIDFRVGADGQPTIIDVNANPCLAPDAGFAMTAAEAGLTYPEMIATIVRMAVSRPRQTA